MSRRGFPLFLLLSFCLLPADSLRAQSPVPDDFNPGAGGGDSPSVLSLAVQADGKILVGGGFTTLAGQTRNNLGRLHADGTLDIAFDPGADDGVLSIALQVDGKILVGGNFARLGGQPREFIGRLYADGTLDASFNPGAAGTVSCLAVQADGKILVGGFFSTLGRKPRSNLGRLNANGTLDTTFNPKADGFVECLAVQTDGKILAGGSFFTLGGQPRRGIGRLHANGMLDRTFNPGAFGDNGPNVNCLAVQADGKILVGGGFTNLGGQARNYLGRLHTNGTLDVTFNPGANEWVDSIALQTDGKILVGGLFTSLGGELRGAIGRLHPNGTLDSSFNPGASGGDVLFGTAVSALTVQADGRILAGGDFAILGGQPRERIARLNNTDPATETLSYAGSTITWLRGGSSPEVWRTTFEHSTNGTTWTSLGAGARIPGGWQKTGVALPAGRTLRARGHVVGGLRSASGWFVETYHGRPVFFSHPGSRTNNVGTTASFQVVVNGGEPLSYHWLKNEVAKMDQGNTAGANSTTLTLSQITKADEGAYRLVVSNNFGSVTSLVATLAVLDPFITQQPAGANRNPGGSVTFNVSASGTPPLNYQWYHAGAAVPGATGASLTLDALSRSDAGPYTVVVSNAEGSATSAPALLSVNVVTVDSAFAPQANGAVLSMAVQADGKILVGGGFTTLAGRTRNRLARLHPDGTLDDTFNPGAVDGTFGFSFVNSLAVQADGKILVGGDFLTLGGQTRYRLGRLNGDGTLDLKFKPVVASFIDWFTEVQTLALQADGKILVGGIFDTLGGRERVNLGRLHANGSLDGDFSAAFTSFDNSQPVSTLAIQADGKILVGGGFTTLATKPRRFLGRLHANGTWDSAFNPGANGEVETLAVQADGKILVGGSFTTLGGQPRGHLARLNLNGTLDTTFNPGASVRDGTFDSPSVYSLAVQTDGKILVGGNFTALGVQTRNRIARLHADGTLDGTFNPGAGGIVRSLAVQADGNILVGGSFSTLGGQSHQSLGRLNNTDPATSSLNQTGATNIWLRGGSGPEVWRTNFEHTTNGLTWKSLGAGTRIAGGWQRPGAPLRPGTTLRARGQVAGSAQNASWFVGEYSGQPVFISQPASRTNGATTTAIFSAAAGGSDPLTYQWLKNGVALADLGNIAGATSATLTLSAVLRADEGAYQVVVSNSFASVTSLVANLTVLNPQITAQPADAFRNAGETVTFHVTALGTPPPDYQWYHDGAAVPGAVSSSLTLPNLSRSDAGQYFVVVSNMDGSVTSESAMLTVNEATLDSPFNLAVGDGWYDVVHSMAFQVDAKILAGGDFLRLAGQDRDFIGRLHADGTLDDSFNPGAGVDVPYGFVEFPFVSSLAVQADGKILAGGLFTHLGGQPRKHLGRLQADGTLDTSFNPGVSRSDGVFPYVNSLVAQPDGRILVGGYFTRLRGVKRSNLGRLNVDGRLDTAFNPGTDGEVYSLALQADGKILVGGDFTKLGGKARSNLGRLHANGTLDSTFNSGAGGRDGTFDYPRVYSLAVQADGKILVGGDFLRLGGQPRSHLGRLHANGRLDTAFNPGTTRRNGIAPSVSSLAVQADGKILVGGSFSALGGQPRDYIGRLHADGTADITFNPGSDDTASSLAVQADGKILVGGHFLKPVFRLNNTEPATQTLTHSDSTITWLRGGSSPEVWRTTFEYSNDGLDWTFLGTGTRIPGGWQLTGISQPTSGTLRARGHVAGGRYNASGWFVETTLGVAPPGAFARVATPPQLSKAPLPPDETRRVRGPVAGDFLNATGSFLETIPATTPGIRLQVVRDGSTVVLSWTGGQGLYQVQQSTNLSQPDSWQDMGTPVQTNSISLPIGPGTLFLRVRGQ